MKRAFTLWLDEELISSVKTLGHSVSSIVNSLLQENLPLIDLALFDLQPLLFRQQLLEQRNRICIQQIELLQGEVKKNGEELAVLNEKIGKILAQKKKVEESKKLAMLYREMNNIIEFHNYNVEASWEACQALLERLAEAGKGLSKEAFIEHCGKLKILRA